MNRRFIMDDNMSEHADKRKMTTDALDTLGTIITDKEKRDAIHLAVFPAIAAHTLRPGEHVGFVEDGSVVGLCETTVGIVDPFLKEVVKRGEHFWLVVYPRQITSLRHVWTHPAFDVPELKPELVDVDLQSPLTAGDFFPATTKAASEAWLRNFCDHADCPGYDTVMEVIDKGDVGDGYGRCYMDAEYLHFGGRDAHGEIPPEFWDHVEIVTGKTFPLNKRSRYFSCSC